MKSMFEAAELNSIIFSILDGNKTTRHLKA